jgi:hypothetical protein
MSPICNIEVSLMKPKIKYKTKYKFQQLRLTGILSIP